MAIDRWTVGVAAFFIIFGLLTLGVWIPNDIESGMIVKFRREILIGDALAPVGVTVGILVSAVALLATAILRPETSTKVPDRQSAIFIGRMLAVIILALVLMAYTGPLVVEMINAAGHDIGTYRQLRDTVPYKYLGYLLGGFVLVFGVIRVIENKFTLSAAWVAVGAVIFLTFVYDVPFDNLLLPPNGDQ
jgi:hypothetical protein